MKTDFASKAWQWAVSPWIAGAFVMAMASGCSREDIRVYDVPKERAGVAAHPALPDRWQALPGDQMRIGNWAVEGKNGAKAQVTIVPLPGVAGGELENVNRWRKQVGLEPIKADALATEAKPAQIAGAPAHLFEMSGVDPKTKVPTGILAALQPHGESVWFFKMMGDDQLVRDQKEAFLVFFAKYQYPDASSAGAGELGGAGAQGSEAGGGLSPAPSANAGEGERSRRSWNAPAGWEQQEPGPMQDAKFLVAGGKATVTVSIFPGETGGVLANVNRWRSQIGLATVDEAGLATLLAPLDLPGTKANLVDMKGPEKRMVAAIVPRGAETWFFKLLGEPAAVEAEKMAFVEFVTTAK